MHAGNLESGPLSWWNLGDIVVHSACHPEGSVLYFCLDAMCFFLVFIWFIVFQHLTWMLGLIPAENGSLKSGPINEIPNLVRGHFSQYDWLEILSI